MTVTAISFSGHEAEKRLSKTKYSFRGPDVSQKLQMIRSSCIYVMLQLFKHYKVHIEVACIFVLTVDLEEWNVFKYSVFLIFGLCLALIVKFQLSLIWNSMFL